MAEKDTQELEKVVKTVKYELTEFTGALKEGKGKIKGGFDELFGGGGPISLLANEVANIGKKAKAFGDIIGGTKDILLSPFKGFQTEEKKKEKAQKKETEARQENTEKVEDLTDEIKKLNKANKKANMVGVSGYGEAGDNDGLLTAGLFANTIGNLTRGASGFIGGLLPLLITGVSLGTLYAMNQAGNRDTSNMSKDMEEYFKNNPFGDELGELTKLIKRLTRENPDAIEVYETNPKVTSDKRDTLIKIYNSDGEETGETVIDGTGDGKKGNEVKLKISPGGENGGVELEVDTFSSGGSTGTQTTGGVDGKGGRVAIVHGNEYIINQKTLDYALANVPGDRRRFDIRASDGKPRFYSEKLGHYINLDPGSLALYAEMMKFENMDLFSTTGNLITPNLPPAINPDGSVNFDRYLSMSDIAEGVMTDRLMADPTSQRANYNIFGESDVGQILATQAFKYGFPYSILPSPSKSFGFDFNTTGRGQVSSGVPFDRTRLPFGFGGKTGTQSVFLKLEDPTLNTPYSGKEYTIRRDILNPDSMGKSTILGPDGKPIVINAQVRDRIKFKLKNKIPKLGTFLDVGNLILGTTEAFEIAVQLSDSEKEIASIIQDFHDAGLFGEPGSKEAMTIRNGALEMVNLRYADMKKAEYARTPITMLTSIGAFASAASTELTSAVKEMRPKEVFKNPKLLLKPSSFLKKTKIGLLLVPLLKGVSAAFVAGTLSDFAVSWFQMNDSVKQTRLLTEMTEEQFNEIQNYLISIGAFQEQPELAQYFAEMQRERARMKLIEMNPDLGKNYTITRPQYVDGMPIFDRTKSDVSVISALNYKALRDFGFVRDMEVSPLSRTYMIENMDGSNPTIYHNGKKMTLEEFDALPPNEKISPRLRPLSDVEQRMLKIMDMDESEYRKSLIERNKIRPLLPSDRNYDSGPVLIDQGQQNTTVNVNPANSSNTNEYLEGSRIN